VREETGRDIGISQPGQRNWADQWGIVGTGEAWEPIGRRGWAWSGEKRTAIVQ
jgi:hypothetical protein